LAKTNGVKIRVAKLNRHAAISNEDAPDSWAKRIRIEADEVASKPMNSAAKGSHVGLATLRVGADAVEVAMSIAFR
jgi:hypothetical protein